MKKDSQINTQYNYFKKVKMTGSVLFLSIFLVLILGPVEVYYSNITDFDFMLKDFFGGFILVSVLIWIILSFAISLLPYKVMTVIDSVIFVVSIEAYIQTMFLNVKIAEIDGTEMKWETLGTVPIRNLIIWIVLFLIGMAGIYLLKEKRWKVMTAASLFLSLIQTAAVIACLIGIATSGKTVMHYQLSGKDQLGVAPDRNIIIIVLDGLSNGYLNKYMEFDGELLQGLEDFTYYSNYDSRFNPTFPSMCHLLTGMEPDTKLTRIQWAKEAWNSDRSVYFYETLHDLGYTCNVYSTRQTYTYGMIENIIGRIDNIEDIESKTNYRLMYPMMLKYSIYRCCPYVLKSRFEVIPEHYRGVVEYTLQDETIDSNAVFYEALMNSRLTVNADWDNAFIVNHIQGVHGPHEIDRNAQYIGEEMATKESVLYGSFAIVREYLTQLKELDLYDDAAIIIMSDHGASAEIEGLSAEESQAVFFIKEPHVSGNEMRINSSPICSDDFQSTILSIAGADQTPCGQSIYDWNEGQRRERITYFMDKSANGGLFGYIYYYDGEDLRETIENGYDIMYYNAEW